MGSPISDQQQRRSRAVTWDNASRRLRLAVILEARTVTGPAKNVIQFCQLAQAEGKLDPLLFVFARGSATDHPILATARKAGVAAEPIFERGRFDRRVISALRNRLRGFQPHVLQTHGVKSHFIIRLSGLNRMYPWIAFHHGYTAAARRVKFYNQLNRWSLRAARMVVTVCGPFAERLCSDGVAKRNIRVLHNSVEPAPPVPDVERDELRQKLGIVQSERVTLSVGRLSREKAHCDLLQAAAHLHARWPSMRVVLVGEGPERVRLESQAAKLGLQKAVLFAGQVANVQPFYAIAHVFVLPSLSEGSPNALLEALAAGIPVVCTAVGGVTELVDHEIHGLLTPPSEPEALAEAIERVFADADAAQERSRQGRERIVRDFAPEAYRKRLFTLYGQVLSSEGGD